MRNAQQLGAPCIDGSLSSDNVAEVTANGRNPDWPEGRHAQTLPARIYGIMAATTLLTFATLTAGYELLFTNQLFA